MSAGGKTRRSVLVAMASGLALPALARRSWAAPSPVRIGVLKFGTVSWELDTIRHHGFDSSNGIALDVTEFAGEDAANIALLAGSIDVMVSDWLWVSRERAQGGDLTFFPFSSSIGGIMVPEASPARSFADLKGKRLAVAGGPLDKSWLLLQAHARRDLGFDPASDCRIDFGAPPLLAEKAEQGEFDAVLNYWQFCARLEAKRFRELIGADDAAAALGAKGKVAVLGYVFHDAWAMADPARAIGLAKASRDAKSLLAVNDGEWERLGPLMRADGAARERLRDRFRDGIPARMADEEEADAALLYKVLAEVGGSSLVGPATDLAPGTFWRGQAG